MISEEPSADSDSMEVDVVGTFPETSAQVVDDPDEPMNQQPEQAPVFETYRSLLDRHPLLRARSRPESSPLAPSSSSTSGSSSSTTQTIDIDLKPLKQAAVMKYLSDNTRQVCQYELPGGGECRDKNCDNVHLSRLSAVEPSGTSLVFTLKSLTFSFPVNPSLCFTSMLYR
ncbi:hypothetical protein L227DRAFT_435754 [Lentinus tigrinus ALCF2SS1-6]|uniref:Zinc-finger domain-containing protein n=1 Tax=Lentinus tigrinus ALCF2SS1-6 TaxID=1328759 RepID=A0A5C2SHJ5_9APHY|nr:hypothetical protein L227DRAFT_435754 [Lentinus tigrinus ALCF2SS1-6]